METLVADLSRLRMVDTLMSADCACPAAAVTGLPWRTRAQACRSRRKASVFIAGLRRGMVLHQGAPGLCSNEEHDVPLKKKNIPIDFDVEMIDPATTTATTANIEENLTLKDFDILEKQEETDGMIHSTAALYSQCQQRQHLAASVDPNIRFPNRVHEEKSERDTFGMFDGAASSFNDQFFDSKETRSLTAKKIGTAGDNQKAKSDEPSPTSSSTCSWPCVDTSDLQAAKECEKNRTQRGDVLEAMPDFPGLPFTSFEDGLLLKSASRSHRKRLDDLQNQELQQQLDHVDDLMQYLNPAMSMKVY